MSRVDKAVREALCSRIYGLDAFKEASGVCVFGGGPIALHGLSEALRAHFTSALESAAASRGGPRAVYIAPNEFGARLVYDDFYALYGDDAIMFPARETIMFDVEARDSDVSHRRARALDRLLRKDFRVVVMGADAAASPVPPPELFSGACFSIEAGGLEDLGAVSRRLTEMGYERVETVEARGTFAVRGGILDVYPVDAEYATRIEMWGDDVDSIRTFDATTQRSLENVKSVRLIPAKDVIVRTADVDAITARVKNAADGAAAVSRGADPPNERRAEALEKRCSSDIEKLRSASYFPGIDKYLTLLYEKRATPFDYVRGGSSENKETVGLDSAATFDARDFFVVMEEPARVKQKLESSLAELTAACAPLIERGQALPSAALTALDFDGLIASAPTDRLVSMSALNSSSDAALIGARRQINAPGTTAVSYQGAVGALNDDLRGRLDSGWTCVLIASSEAKASRLAETIGQDGIKTRLCFSGGDVERSEEASGDGNRAGIEFIRGYVNIIVNRFARSFEYPGEKLIVIGESMFAGTARARKRAIKRPEKGRRIEYYTDLSVGDYIVHVTHGVGIYEGLKRIAVDGIVRDYLSIKYKGDDNLYIPTAQLDLVQKYVGSEGRAPRVNGLNSAEWAKTKQKVKNSLRKLAAELVLIYKQRRDLRGRAFSRDSEWQRQFEDLFPYAETRDQLLSVEEIKADMESPRVMDRLLCGDVGFGKTEVALRAAFKAVGDGAQVAFLAPTTVLAQQHYQTFVERFREFPIKIDVLSRFRTDKERRAIADGLANGGIDVIVGTHRLLSKSIRFKDLGLLVVDEEQRFGVAQKDRIKLLKPDVDVLTLSATPIPRTLHMSMTRIRDISVLKDPPEDRSPVQTFVMEYDEDVTREAILREVARGGQVFYLFNRVMGIDIKASQLRASLPESVRVACAHGQMGDRELEDVMLAFINRQADVLVCTTIIESGLDIPNVNTIIVEDADRMGLAQLYQLRGRVGRSNRVAYAYITHRKDKAVTEVSEKRLKAIRDFTELGSGFKIAMRDMEIRGIGNLLGTEQHGHMESVGYDMYCRLLDEAVIEIEREQASVASSAPSAPSTPSALQVLASQVSSASSAPSAPSAPSASQASASQLPASQTSPAGTALASGARRPQETASQDVTIDLKISAYIDGGYIDDDAKRLEMYQKIAAIRTDADADDVLDELTDRYREPPPETAALIKVATLRALALRCGILSIGEKSGAVIMRVASDGRFDTRKLVGVLANAKYKRRILFSAGTAPSITLKSAAQQTASRQNFDSVELLDDAISFLKDLSI